MQNNKNPFYFWAYENILREQQENPVFWYEKNILQQQNEKGKTEESENKTITLYQNNNTIIDATDRRQSVQNLYEKPQKLQHISIWKKENQQQRQKEKIEKETIQNIINDSLEQVKQPKKQQEIQKEQQNISIDTLIFHLTEKLLEERERSLRGSKKI